MTKDDKLKVELEILRKKHKDLDLRIEELKSLTEMEKLILKKQKLVLKDKIIAIEKQIYDDIIA